MNKKLCQEFLNAQFKKGYIPWNKGKHHSEETKKIISEKLKGHIHTKETKRKISEMRKGKAIGKNNQWWHKIPPNWKNLYTPEINKKRRIARLKQILPTKDTLLELKVKNYLDKLGIQYIHPFNLGDRFQCDFYIPTLYLIIECDGTYWHSREDMKKRDKAKDAYAKKCGFNILRLSEEQINQGRFPLG